MPEVAFTVMGTPARSGGRRAAAYLVTESGKRVDLTWAPMKVTRAGLAGAWATLTRPGRKALTQWAAPGQETLTFTATLGSLDQQTSAQGIIDALVDLVATRERVRLVYAGFEGGWWSVTDCSLTSEQRNEQHQVVLATAAITLTEAPKMPERPGRTSTGGGRGGGGGNPGGGATIYDPSKFRIYTIRKGDTLFKIAQRLLGDGRRWKEIARANSLKKPKAIKPGQRIKVPKK